MDIGIVLNPNKDKNVKATEILNGISKNFRNSVFFRKFVKSEGFELSLVDFKWEWIITLNNEQFIVFREDSIICKR